MIIIDDISSYNIGIEHGIDILQTAKHWKQYVQNKYGMKCKIRMWL